MTKFLSFSSKAAYHYRCALMSFRFVLSLNVILSLTGIGVDNMFVVVGSYKRLSHSELSLPLNQRIGKLLRPAGVYVLVTSVTDILVFGVGGTTVSTFQSFSNLFCRWVYSLSNLVAPWYTQDFWACQVHFIIPKQFIAREDTHVLTECFACECVMLNL